MADTPRDGCCPAASGGGSLPPVAVLPTAPPWGSPQRFSRPPSGFGTTLRPRSPSPSASPQPASLRWRVLPPLVRRRGAKSPFATHLMTCGRLADGAARRGCSCWVEEVVVASIWRSLRAWRPALAYLAGDIPNGRDPDVGRAI